MIRTKAFWVEEKDAPLLNLDLSYLSDAYGPDAKEASRKEAIDAMCSTWADTVLEKAKAFDAESAKSQATETRDPEADATNPDNYSPGGRPVGTRGAIDLPDVAREGIDRIFVADADRTFRDQGTRNRFVALLSHLSDRFGDYHQGLSYVASFLLLTQGDGDKGADFERVARILDTLNDSDFYVADYWAAEAVRFATDAHVFSAILEKEKPAIHAHLGTNCLSPDTYCQKWFVGLCVHVLPFEVLFTFFDEFFKQGKIFLFKFAIALCTTLEDRLVSAKGPGELLGLLRLDRDVIGADAFVETCSKIVETARGVDLSSHDIAALRKTAYEVTVWPRVRRARERMAEEDSDSEIVFSDETTDEDEEVDALADKVADAAV